MELAATWFSILPPLLAIVAGLVLREVVPALFLGVWLAAWGLAGLDGPGLLSGLLAAIQHFILAALADPDHAAVILFSCMIGGLVGIVTRSGGMHGVVALVVRHARTRRRGQLATVLLGLAVFIDDYANSLLVGKSMQAVTDRLGISREKLAYLVDSTAAPVSAVALISTWIGYQLGLLGAAIAATEGLQASAYGLFLQSLPYSFYPWLALFLVFWVAASGRDFGPMLVAESRAMRQLSSPGPAAGEHTEPRSVNALLPLLVLVGGVLVGLYLTGEGDGMREIIGSANAYQALTGASLVAVLVALALPLAQRQVRLAALMTAWVEGVQSMVPAMIVLVLAWALAAATRELETAGFLISLLGDSLPVGAIPALVFLLAAATAFATGTSWGTMGILIPLIVPLAYGLAPGQAHILHAGIAAVLAGAVWGDHCSPISDTTILSSMASGCDHVAHVRTQLPYAGLAGVVALLFGVLPSGFGMPWWLSMALAAVTIVLLMRRFARVPATPNA